VRQVNRSKTLFIVGCAVWLTACANDVKDAQCTPDAFEFGLDEDCPYKAAQGPQVPTVGCELTTDEPELAPSWLEVFETLRDVGQGNCSDSGCHGDENTAALGIWLPSDDPSGFYDALTETTGSIGTPYIDTSDPEKSWIHCNVRGTPGGGFPMPKPSGMPTEEAANLVQDWILIGAPGPVN